MTFKEAGSFGSASLLLRVGLSAIEQKADYGKIFCVPEIYLKKEQSGDNGYLISVRFSLN